MGKLNRKNSETESKKELVAIIDDQEDDQIIVNQRTGRKVGKKQIMIAIHRNHAMLSYAATELGMPLYKLKALVENDEKIKRTYQDAEDQEIDYFRGELRKQAQKGNVAAQIFYLKTKGKTHGFIEDQKVDLSALTKPIVFNYNVVTQDAVKALKKNKSFKQIEE
jgi:hypothetical protein